MFNLFNFIRSSLRPVTYEAGGRITVIIRGRKFEGRTRDEVCQQVRDEAESLRKRLSSDSADTARMMPSTGLHGRLNVAAVNLKNTMAALEAYMSYLRSNCP